MTNLKAAKAKLNELTDYVNQYRYQDQDKVRNLVWEVKYLLEKVKP